MRSLLLLLALGPALALAEASPEPAPVDPAAVPAAAPAAPADAAAPTPDLPPPPPPPAGPADAAAPDAAGAALQADLPPPPPPPSADAPWPRFGMKLEVGVPDAAVVALLFRPVPWLRLSAGPAWDYIGWGLQAGASWTPVRWAVSPTLNVEYGHFFDADASKFAKAPKPGDTDVRPLLKKVGYDYWSGQVGLEFGSQRGFAFYLRGGLSYFKTAIHGASETISSGTNPGDTQVAVTDPKIRAVIPSAKLGFQLFF